MAELRRNPAALPLPGGALVILCGPAASGKTTWARRWFVPTEVLSSDEFRGLLSDDPADQSVSAQAFRVLETVARLRLRQGRLTVVDSTALEPRARARLRRLARDAGRAAVLVVFDIGEAECRRRDLQRDRRVGARVITEHRAALARVLTNLPREPYHLAAVLDGPGADAIRVFRSA